jgi:hypothetical protein
MKLTASHLRKLISEEVELLKLRKMIREEITKNIRMNEANEVDVERVKKMLMNWDPKASEADADDLALANNLRALAATIEKKKKASAEASKFGGSSGSGSAYGG